MFAELPDIKEYFAIFANVCTGKCLLTKDHFFLVERKIKEN